MYPCDWRQLQRLFPATNILFEYFFNCFLDLEIAIREREEREKKNFSCSSSRKPVCGSGPIACVQNGSSRHRPCQKPMSLVCVYFVNQEDNETNPSSHCT